MPLWARPAAAAGAFDTARQARFRKAVCAAGAGLRAALARQAARSRGSHASPLRHPPGAGVRARRGGGGGAERKTAQEPGATSHAGSQWPFAPQVTSEEGGEGYFRGSSEEPGTPCPRRKRGERRVLGSKCGTAALFKAHRPPWFLWPPCHPRFRPNPSPDACSLAVDASSPPGRPVRARSWASRRVAYPSGARPGKATFWSAALPLCSPRVSAPHAGRGRLGKGGAERRDRVVCGCVFAQETRAGRPISA